MPGQKVLAFDPRNLYSLLVHYTDGGVPLNGEVTGVLVHPHLSRYLALEVESEEWEEETPLHIRYAGKRVMSWKKGDGDPEWMQRNETPRKQ